MDEVTQFLPGAFFTQELRKTATSGLEKHILEFCGNLVLPRWKGDLFTVSELSARRGRGRSHFLVHD